MSDKPKAVAVKVGESNPIKRVWGSITGKNKNNRNPDKKPKQTLGKPGRIWFILVAAVVIGGLITWWFIKNAPKSTNNKDKVVFVINGKKYKETEVKQYTDFLTIDLGKNKEDATKDVFELLKYKIVAQKLDIKLSTEQIKATTENFNRIYASYKDTSEYKKWVELASLKESIDKNFMTYSDKLGYKGYSFILWFGNHISYTEDYTPPGGYGNKTFIEEDRNYAKQRADYYHDQLKNSKMSPDKALEEIKKDPKLGYHYTAGANLSVRFGTDLEKSWDSQVQYNSVKEYINNNSKIALSDVLIGKTTGIISAKGQREERETFYYIVKIDGTAPSRVQLQNELKALKTNYYGTRDNKNANS